MLYGHCNFSDGKKLVIFTGIVGNGWHEKIKEYGPCVHVRICETKYFTPISKPIKHHLSKHGVVIHGENVVYRDWLD